jgi:hypothetical protein
MKNKPVIVDLSHRRMGNNKLVAEIEQFLPVTVPTQASGI